MMPFILRIVKRLAVLVIGGFFVYLAVWQVFPFFDNRVPIAVALFVTYVVMAYFIIPLLFRAFRFFYRPKHVPLYCTTPDGFASDPINIGLLGSRRQVILSMEAAGWHQADSHSPINVLRQIMATFLQRSYPNAPMSRLYLFGRKQDLAFEMEIDGTRGFRHHVRFWAAETRLATDFAAHVSFWQRFRSPKLLRPGAQLWVGAASKDIGFAPIRHNAQVTHMIDPDTDRERELIVKGLKRAKKIRTKRTISVYRPYSLKNRAFRGFLRSDGNIVICELR